VITTLLQNLAAAEEQPAAVKWLEQLTQVMPTVAKQQNAAVK
jgi:hypothetical protein